MDLTLSSADLGRLERALTTLLSPLDSPTVDHWRGAANQSVRELLGAEKAVFVLPWPGSAPMMGEGVESHALDAYAQYFASQDVGLQRQRELGLDVWSVLNLVDSSSHRRTEIWNDWKAPNALWGATGISVEMEGLPAGLICYDPAEDERLEERQVGLLRLVKSAFVAGVRTYRRMADRRTNLTQSVDVLGDPVGLYDLYGRLVHANPALVHLLGAEPEHHRLVREMERVAGTLAGMASRHTKTQESGIPGPCTGEVEACGRYRVAGTYMGDDLFGPGTTVMVTVHVLRRPTPSEEALRSRFGLTRREAAIAVLLLQGLTNEEIARRLHVSPHTARHHTESVFLKLGVHSRVELSQRVLGVG